jgi:hypothetical protein
MRVALMAWARQTDSAGNAGAGRCTAGGNLAARPDSGRTAASQLLGSEIADGCSVRTYWAGTDIDGSKGCATSTEATAKVVSSPRVHRITGAAWQ